MLDRGGAPMDGPVGRRTLVGACVVAAFDLERLHRTERTNADAAGTPTACIRVGEPGDDPAAGGPRGHPARPREPSASTSRCRRSPIPRTSRILCSPYRSRRRSSLLGHVDDEPFRTEVTLLPETGSSSGSASRSRSRSRSTSLSSAGASRRSPTTCTRRPTTGPSGTSARMSFDFRDGAIVVTEGTWLAGKDGPAAMIMPGDPQVGDVYRTENAPGFVFEEVTVKSVSQTLDGPLGPIEGGMLGLGAPCGREHRGEDLRARLRGVLHVRGKATSRHSRSRYRRTRSPTSMPRGAHLDVGRRALRVRCAGSKNWKTASATVSTWLPPGRPTEAGDVPRLIEPVDGREPRALHECGRRPERRPILGTPRSRWRARASTSSSDTARWPRSISLGWTCGRLNCWWTRPPGTTRAVAADAFAMDYVRDRIRTALDESDLDASEHGAGRDPDRRGRRGA